MRNVTLNKDQRKVLTEISGNTAVAWFSIGFISPILIRSESTSKLIEKIVVGLFMSGLFTLFAVRLMRRKKK